MAEDGVSLDIQASDLRQLLQDVRRLENAKPLKRELGQAMRNAGKPMLRDIRRNAHAIPSSRALKRAKGEPHALRKSISKAAKIQVRTGAKGAGLVIRIDPRKMPAGMNNLPGYMEGSRPFERWRHPVFGTSAYVTQKPHPYFLNAIKAHESQALREVGEALDKIRRHLET